MEEEKILEQLERGEVVNLDAICKLVVPYLNAGNVRLLCKKLICLANNIEYQYLKDKNSCIMSVELGKLFSISQLLFWNLFKTQGTAIFQVSQSREFADFVKGTPEMIQRVKNESNE